MNILSEWTSDDAWIWLTAGLTALSCSITGAYLVLNRRSMAGDALGHSILPGLVLGYLVFPGESFAVYFLSAALVGLLALYLIDAYSTYFHLSNDAAIGVIYTAFFAMGVILITRFAGNVHLDLDAVLMGELLFVPLDTVEIAGTGFPRATFNLLCVNVVLCCFGLLFAKPLLVEILDPTIYQLYQPGKRWLNFASTLLTAVVIVACFEAVGSILVLGFLATGPAFALPYSQRIPTYILLSVLFTLLGSGLGLAMAYRFNWPLASSMAFITGTLFFLQMSFRHGIKLIHA